MTKLMPYVDVCIANEEDIQKMLGICVNNTDVEKGKLDIDSYCRVAKGICNIYGCEYVAITLRKSYSASINGWSALFYDHKNDTVNVSKEYDIQLVDRVGGGDSFSAGIIYGLISKESDKNIIEFAVAASCLKQSMEGDFNRSSVDDVKSLMNGGGSGRVLR